MNNAEIYNKAIMNVNMLTEQTIDEFSDLVIKLSMSGECAQVSNLFDEGDDIILSVGDFLNTKDKKVQQIIKVLNSLRDLQNILGNTELN